MVKPIIPSHIYEAGKAAQRAGKPRSSCPYTKGASRASHERREWLKGYDEERHGGPQQFTKEEIAGQLRNTNALELWIRAELPDDQIPPSLPTAGIPDVGGEELPPNVQYV